MPSGGIQGRPPQTRAGGMSLYIDPDPVQVARIWHSHGYHAVIERWHWKTPTDLYELRAVGLSMLEAA